MKADGTRKKIFIIDDHPIVRLGLRQIISLEKDLEVCGEAANANDGMKLISQKTPYLVTVDLSLDGDMSGLDVIKAIRARFRDMKILVISMYEGPLYVDRAIRAGANGYIHKKNAYNSIIEAIKKISSGELYLNENMTSQLLNRIYPGKTKNHETIIDVLTDREFEIFQMIGSTYNTKEISKKTGISINTVQTHKRHIKEKLGLKNHSELIGHAVLFIQKQSLPLNPGSDNP